MQLQSLIYPEPLSVSSVSSLGFLQHKSSGVLGQEDNGAWVEIRLDEPLLAVGLDDLKRLFQTNDSVDQPDGKVVKPHDVRF